VKTYEPAFLWMNLDAISRDELLDFWKEVHCGPVKVARQLFPERPTGYVRATVHLGYYATNKAAAMYCRAKGDIPGAQVYEKICDRLYGELPPFAKTW
jgi:hypothetical protein